LLSAELTAREQAERTVRDSEESLRRLTGSLLQLQDAERRKFSREQRIETIFERMRTKAQGKKCKAMEGLVEEGSEVLEEDIKSDIIKDAALIAAAQRVEHYEIAGYGCVRAYATRLGDNDAANLLAQTVKKEKEEDKTLNDIAEELNLDIPLGDHQFEKTNCWKYQGVRSQNKVSRLIYGTINLPPRGTGRRFWSPPRVS
jgi:ferritin-like metal-binding protein YciE